MSEWRETLADEMEIDGDEINVLIDTDHNGNIYTTIKIKDVVKMIADKFNSLEE